MCRRMVSLIVVVLALGAVASGADISWTGGGGDNLWSTRANWSPSRVPNSGDVAFVDVPAAKGPTVWTPVSAMTSSMLEMVATLSTGRMAATTSGVETAMTQSMAAMATIECSGMGERISYEALTAGTWFAEVQELTRSRVGFGTIDCRATGAAM